MLTFSDVETKSGPLKTDHRNLEKMMAKKAKRACSYCQVQGHNARTCEKKKADEAAGVVRSLAPVPSPSSSTALAVVDPTPQETPSPAMAHQPIEYEEAVKQVHVNGTTLRLAVREFESGLADLLFRITRGGGKPQDISFDQEVGAKAYEMLGWALQQIAARRNLKSAAHRSPTNGQARPEARTV